MKLQGVKLVLSAVGVTCVYKGATEEFRVNFVDGNEDTAYYATELEDALNTGLDMAARRQSAIAKGNT